MIDAVIARLLPDDDFDALKSVAGAVDLADIMENQFAVPPGKRPAAYVMLAGEQASPNEIDTGTTAQIVTQSVSVAFCVGAGEQAGKAIARDAVMEVRDAVLGRLLGWSPDGLGVLTYGGLAMLALRPRAVWFQMIFARRIGVSG